MTESNRKLQTMLWAVIAVLIIGAGIGGILLMNRVNDLTQSNTQLNGDNDSLRRQLKEAKSTPIPIPTPTATPMPTVATTPLPKVTITPKAVVTPKVNSLK